MSTIPVQTEPLAVNVVVDEVMLRIDIADGRELAVPLEWFPKLRDASPEDRAHWRLIGGGEGIHWPNIDEDISVLRLFGLDD